MLNRHCAPGSLSQTSFVMPSPLPKPTSGILTCGICQEPFLQTRNPFKASQTPNSSSRVTFGQVFPCPGSHGYCIDCTTSYIRDKLEDGGSDRIVFPIRCPECSPLVWQMDDETAAAVLSPDLLDVWHHQKLLESLPKVRSWDLISFFPNTDYWANYVLNEVLVPECPMLGAHRH